MKSAPKKKMTSESCPPCAKDWHGSHWHMVGWLAAVAIVLSASTMTLSASAATTPAVTPTILYRAITDVKVQLTRIEGKLDAVKAKLDAQSQPPAPSDLAPAYKTSNSPAPDITACYQACEDDFTACSKLAGTDQTKYAACKDTYSACYTKCQQPQ
jgi:hypothetical protein